MDIVEVNDDASSPLNTFRPKVPSKNTTYDSLEKDMKCKKLSIHPYMRRDKLFWAG